MKGINLVSWQERKWSFFNMFVEHKDIQMISDWTLTTGNWTPAVSGGSKGFTPHRDSVILTQLRAKGLIRRSKRLSRWDYFQRRMDPRENFNNLDSVLCVSVCEPSPPPQEAADVEVKVLRAVVSRSQRCCCNTILTDVKERSSEKRMFTGGDPSVCEDMRPPWSY